MDKAESGLVTSQVIKCHCGGLAPRTQLIDVTLWSSCVHVLEIYQIHHARLSSKLPFLVQEARNH